MFKRISVYNVNKHFHICLFWKLAFPAGFLKVQTRLSDFLTLPLVSLGPSGEGECQGGV